MSLINLENRLLNKKAVIGVVGLGYVGLPLLIRLAEAGYKVVGFDVNVSHIERLQAGKSPFNHITDRTIGEKLVNAILTDDFSQAAEVDALILCLPTPLNQYREPDLSYIENSLQTLLPYLHSGMLISLESTTWPGTTEEVMQKIIETNNLKVGDDVALVYSPEREDPGNPDFTLEMIPKVVGGVTKTCLRLGEALYSSIVDDVVPVSSTRAAELTKLLENIQRSVNIGLMNEMKTIAKRMDIDIFEVIKAAATKPFGFTPYYPGPGLGGHCIPIDPFYLTWKAREYGLHTRFIELSGEINASMPEYVVNGLVSELSNNLQKAINGAKILIVGIAYKKNINDVRESPAFAIMELLKVRKAKIDYFDPYVSEIPLMREHKEMAGMTSIRLADLHMNSFDAAIIVTNHDDIDYGLLKSKVPLIIDTRNVFDSNIGSNGDYGAEIVKY